MKTIILYSTKYGATKECSELLSIKLKGSVDIKVFDKKDEVYIDGYDTVIIGGAVYMGRIRKEITDFCEKNLKGLSKKRIGLFTSCMSKDEAAEKQLNTVYKQELLNHAIAKGCFGGKINADKMSRFDKFIVNMISKSDPNFPKLDKDKSASFILEENISEFADKINNI